MGDIFMNSIIIYFFYPFIGDFTLFFIDDFTHGCGHWFGRFFIDLSVILPIFRLVNMVISLVTVTGLVKRSKIQQCWRWETKPWWNDKKISNFDLGAGLGTRTSGWFKLATRLTYPFITPVNVDQIKAIFEE